MPNVTRDRLIDGWRGVSVTLVIIGHMIEHRFSDLFVQTPFRTFVSEGLHAGNAWAFASNILARALTPLPALGVDIFFMTSGFLIARLLIAEEAANGRISLKAFYVRRAFRILPAFYFYLATVFCLAAAGLIVVPALDFAKSGLFLCSLPDAKCAWWVGHSWSLGVEEQFYLVFPLAFIVLKRWRVAALACMLALLTALYFNYPRSLSFAQIMFGALAAASPAVHGAVARIAGRWAIAAAALVIVAQPFFDSLPIYPALNAARPLLIGVIFFGTLNQRGPFVGLVSMSAFHRIGLVSYSLYLWQQLSTADAALYAAAPVGLIPILFIAPALVSYVAIEKPMIALGRRASAAATAAGLRGPREAPASPRTPSAYTPA
ncbi:MAG: putative rane protein [Hyphomicrobiales bacterium]|nr:putative rane protein [Hyphomicrobiales bacterium]